MKKLFIAALALLSMGSAMAANHPITDLTIFGVQVTEENRDSIPVKNLLSGRIWVEGTGSTTSMHPFDIHFEDVSYNGTENAITVKEGNLMPLWIYLHGTSIIKTNGYFLKGSGAPNGMRITGSGIMEFRTKTAEPVITAGCALEVYETFFEISNSNESTKEPAIKFTRAIEGTRNNELKSSGSDLRITCAGGVASNISKLTVYGGRGYEGITVNKSNYTLEKDGQTATEYMQMLPVCVVRDEKQNIDVYESNEDILGDGLVSYNADNETLTLKRSLIPASGAALSINHEMTLNVVGTDSLVRSHSQCAIDVRSGAKLVITTAPKSKLLIHTDLLCINGGNIVFDHAEAELVGDSQFGISSHDSLTFIQSNVTITSPKGTLGCDLSEPKFINCHVAEPTEPMVWKKESLGFMYIGEERVTGTVRIVADKGKHDDDEAIRNTEMNSAISKRFVNGQLVIIRDGKSFNMVGAEL